MFALVEEALDEVAEATKIGAERGDVDATGHGFDLAPSAFSCEPRVLRSILALIAICGGSSLVRRER
jgi:hypothetical protein